MKFSEQTDKIIPALLKVQKNMGSAKKGADNPFFKSKYADLGSVMEACKQNLNDEGIFVIQTPSVVTNETGETDHYLSTTLMHESGQFISGEMKLIMQKNDMQQYGSAITYARRYCLQSMVFLSAEDDDGEKSMGRKTVGATKTTRSFKKPTTKSEITPKNDEDKKETETKSDSQTESAW